MEMRYKILSSYDDEDVNVDLLGSEAMCTCRHQRFGGMLCLQLPMKCWCLLVQVHTALGYCLENEHRYYFIKEQCRRFGGVVVSVLATGPKGFESNPFKTMDF
jgi:hypothetical protein